MEKKIELLAPGGDVDSIKAAILAGANAVYCGLDRFNARNRAANISFEALRGVIKLAHSYDCEVFLTINILILENEISSLIDLLNKLVNTSIDGIIVQDLGLFYILSKHFSTLKIHASTQTTTHNEGQIKFLRALGAERVNLSRELSLEEIKHLTSVAKLNGMQTEVFVHGSQCICFSGVCYMSSVFGGQSGNRGRCSQPCRDKYETTPAGINYPLNLKDNAAYTNIGELYDAGVYSFKIEGRIKRYDYVYTVIDSYKKQIDSWLNKKELLNEKDTLYKVFNRDFSNAYLTSNVSKYMFIDNPRDYSVLRLADRFNSDNEAKLSQSRLLDEKERIKIEVEDKIKDMSIEKEPITLFISGKVGSPLTICTKSSTASFKVSSKLLLSNKGTEALCYNNIFKRLKAINDTEYFISEIDLGGIKADVFLPFKELTLLKNKLLFLLNNCKESIAPVQLPKLVNYRQCKPTPSLSVVISSLNDIGLCSETESAIYFQLPSDLRNNLSELIEIFNQERRLIPWFPSILIGDEYNMALEFMKQVQPNTLVTDNTGIAFEAYHRGLNWIAGPSLNIVNSFSLECLKEKFNCSGAFISNELSRLQMKGIKKPKDFKLYYSIYHPIVLMTTRQCLFQQITGCEKEVVDASCLKYCNRITSIKNTKGDSFIVEKTKGSHHHIFHSFNHLNTDIVHDIPDLFDAFFIDLKDVKTETKVERSKLEVIRLFEKQLVSNRTDKEGLSGIIYPTINSLYKKGV